MPTNTATRGITTFGLIMLILGAVDSIRNLPAAALFGSTLIFFYLFSAVFFLIPSALVSAELASAWTEQGGICYWIKLAFGEKWAFLAIWLQWIANLVWFPTILSFIAGIAAYLFDPSLASNKLYMVSVILGLFWALTLINLKGIHLSAKFVSFCTLAGLALPMTLIIGLALFWMLRGHHAEVSFGWHAMIPSFNTVDSWVSLTAIMTAYAGMELSAVHIRDVDHPQKTFPRALFISVILIIVTMTLGSLAIAIVLPKEQINLVGGIMQAYTYFFAAYHISWLMPIMGLMIFVGTLGGIICWVIAPAKGLLQAAQMGFLPKFLRQENKHGVATNLLIAQAVIVTIVCVAFLFMPSVNSSYWLLTALNIQLYICMYVLMFIAAIYLRYKYPKQERAFKIPGGNLSMWGISILGLIGCAITLTVGFFPPSGMNVGSLTHYEIVFFIGLGLMLAPIVPFMLYRAITHTARAKRPLFNDKPLVLASASNK